MKINKILWPVLVIIVVALCVWILFFPGRNRKETGYYQIIEPDFSQKADTFPFNEIVGPEGNPYADPEFYKSRESLPFEMLPEPVAQRFQALVPEYKNLNIQKRESKKPILWHLKADMDGGGSCSLYFLQDGRITSISTVITSMSERMGKVIANKSMVKEIPLKQIPEPVSNRLKSLHYGQGPFKAYSAEALGGPRIFAQLEEGQDGLILSFTHAGEIRSGGRARSMLSPYKPPKAETMEEVQANLSKYGKKYNVQNVLKQIKKVRINKEEGFRFSVFGDTRSSLKVWMALVQSVNRWNPLFAVDVGDFTPRGYSKDVDRYLLKTLEEFASFPFLPVVGNHDIYSGGLSYEYAFGGKDSTVYHFDIGGCCFVVLDNTERERAVPWEDQLKMADKWLSVKSRCKFVFIHLPPPEVKKWAYHAMDEQMSRPFVKLMTEHKVDHVFCGHIHAYSTATYDGVKYTITGGGGATLHKQYGEKGSVNHYLIVDVLPDQVKIRVVRLIPSLSRE